jgi:hypothetical protein
MVRPAGPTVKAARPAVFCGVDPVGSAGRAPADNSCAAVKNRPTLPGVDLLSQTATFVRVVEVGSLSAAARRLGLSLPAGSRQLAALEAELGGRLVLRTTRRLKVTEAGERYYARCVRVLREAAVAGLGVALLLEWLVEADLASGALRPPLADWSAPTVTVLALHRAELRQSPGVRAFLEHVRAARRKGREPRAPLSPALFAASTAGPVVSYPRPCSAPPTTRTPARSTTR